MSAQIIFFKKNRLDIDYSNITITGSEGVGFENFLRNRLLTSGWATTGSVDANNTTLIVDMSDYNLIDSIILSGHNLASYKIEQWNGSAYVAMPTPIDIAGNTLTTTSHYFPLTLISKFRITIRGTIVANQDKFITNLVATAKIGQLQGWPVITQPKISRARKPLTLLSGKSAIRENVGFVSFSLTCAIWNIDSDLTIVERCYDSNEGFIVWLSGGDQTQFASVRKGYRAVDMPLMKCKNEHSPEYYKGLYKAGMKIQMDLTEVIS